MDIDMELTVLEVLSEQGHELASTDIETGFYILQHGDFEQRELVFSILSLCEKEVVLRLLDLFQSFSLEFQKAVIPYFFGIEFVEIYHYFFEFIKRNPTHELAYMISVAFVETRYPIHPLLVVYLGDKPGPFF